MDNKGLPLNVVHLKIIATISMVMDHICAVLFRYNASALMIRYTVGRIAFPVFAYMLVEGFIYTRSRAKYARNILITALITEPFYDLALHGSLWYPENQNICFTLLLGLIMLCVLEKASLKMAYMAATVSATVQLGIIVAFCAGFYLLRLDYDISAGIIFVVFYYLRKRQNYQKVIAGNAVFAAVMQLPGALLAIVPLLLYNEKRGKMPKGGKFVFYVVYPLQFVVLLVVKCFC